MFFIIFLTTHFQNYLFTKTYRYEHAQKVPLQYFAGKLKWVTPEFPDISRVKSNYLLGRESDLISHSRKTILTQDVRKWFGSDLLDFVPFYYMGKERGSHMVQTTSSFTRHLITYHEIAKDADYDYVVGSNISSLYGLGDDPYYARLKPTGTVMDDIIFQLSNEPIEAVHTGLLLLGDRRWSGHYRFIATDDPDYWRIKNANTYIYTGTTKDSAEQPEPIDISNAGSLLYFISYLMASVVFALYFAALYLVVNYALHFIGTKKCVACGLSKAETVARFEPYGSHIFARKPYDQHVGFCKYVFIGILSIMFALIILKPEHFVMYLYALKIDTMASRTDVSDVELYWKTLEATHIPTIRAYLYAVVLFYAAPLIVAFRGRDTVEKLYDRFSG